MTVTVFLGPSLPLEEARRILPQARFRPPAAQGDLLSCLRQDQPRIVALIDGTFHQNLSVWHTEICYLLSRGVAVYGSSSMGALRAVETEAFGMVGVGRVFEWYRDGLITADDEVALLHSDEDWGFRGLSVPLVNIRASLERALGAGAIDQGTHDQAVELARAVQYRDRQIATLVERCEAAGLDGQALAGVRHALTDGYLDIKRLDARELLERVRCDAETSLASPSPSFEFNSSGGFEGLNNVDRKVVHAGIELPLQSIAEHVALHSPQFETLRAASLHRSVCLFFASLVEVRITEAEVEAQRKRFLQTRALEDDARLEAWLAENDFSRADFENFIHEEALCARLRNWILGVSQFDRGAKALLDELRRLGAYPEWARRAAEDKLIADSYFELQDYEPFRSADPAGLAQSHGESTGVRIVGDAGEWAEERGFESVVGLEGALRRAAVCDDVRRRLASVSAILEQPVD
jgi:hypothetical protein